MRAQELRLFVCEVDNCESQIIWREACTFRDSGEHAWSYLLAVMEREHEVGPAVSAERAMRT